MTHPIRTLNDIHFDLRVCNIKIQAAKTCLTAPHPHREWAFRTLRHTITQKQLLLREQYLLTKHLSNFKHSKLKTL